MIKCPCCDGTGPFDPTSKSEVACGECGEVFQPPSEQPEQAEQENESIGR